MKTSLGEADEGRGFAPFEFTCAGQNVAGFGQNCQKGVALCGTTRGPVQDGPWHGPTEGEKLALWENSGQIFENIFLEIFPILLDI